MGGFYRLWVLTLAMGIAGCEDDPPAAGTTNVRVQVAACFGGEDTGSACRTGLDGLVMDGASNGCFVAALEGAANTAQYVPVRWADGRLTPTGEGEVDLNPGETIEAALFLYGAGFDPARCAVNGVSPTDRCADEPACVIKMVQPPTVVPVSGDGVTFDFRDNGVCQVEHGAMGPSERCDGEDNDCDGAADEDFDGLGDACSAGEGACRQDGTIICNPAGDGVICDAEAAGVGDEICDGADNDCDGSIDEGLPVEECCDLGIAPVACGSAVPGSVCAAGTRTCEPRADGPKGRLGDCVDGNGTPVVLPGEQVEVCNGIDEDCDRSVDEDIIFEDADQTTEGNQQAAVGERCLVLQGGCAAQGLVACNPMNMAFCDHPPINRGDEICDDVDNDCDGMVDEEFTGQGLDMPCALGVGGCRADGRFVCGPDQASVVCSAQAGAPEDVDLCGNGIDDDCDGRSDEGYPNLGEDCSVGRGACRANGQFVCSPDDMRSAVCGAEEGQAGEELCDGIDNNCDGAVDEPFDTTSDPNNCGRCGRACRLDNAVAECSESECVIDSCLEGFRDVDGRADNGCECNPGEPDPPDPTFTDSNCDGVDGVEAQAIFVSIEAGNDALGNGSLANPYRTLARATEVARTLAELNNFRDIYLDVGRYDVTENNADPDAALTGLLVPPGVSIHGGYRYDPGEAADPNDDAWARGPRADFTTTITGAQIVLRFQGTPVDGLGRPVLLDNLRVETIMDGAVPPMPTVGVAATDVGDHLTLRDVEIVAHQGARGSDGTDGMDGLALAGPGASGLPGNAGQGQAGVGGDGGTNAGCSNVEGGRGGDGENAADDGGDAQPGSISPDAGNNDRAGAPGPIGDDGDPGDDGANGGNAAPGGAGGRVDPAGAYWIARPSGNAGTGAPGGPGGGGGGGVAPQNNTNGGGGGGGGSGGCAGSGGRGAQGGAGSFGLQILGGLVHLQSVTIRSGAGGDGGHGGDGGLGTDGALGGIGGAGSGRDAEPGGDGGRGGRGGCGGHAGGGAGGPSFAILRLSTSAVAADLAESNFVFEEYDGQAIPDRRAILQASLTAGAAGEGGMGGERDMCGGAAQNGPAGVASRLGCCPRGRGANNCNSLRCQE